MTFKTMYNRDKWTKEPGEVNKKPSQTIPDQTMSIPELIRRYAQGLPLGAPVVGTYDEDPENDILQGVNFNTLDLSEKASFIKAAKKELDDISDRLKKPRVRKTKEPESEINNPE